MAAWVTILVAIISSFGGGSLVALLLVKRQARKITAETDVSKANATEILSRVAVQLVGPITKQLKQAEVRAEDLSHKLQLADVELAQLRVQIDVMSKDLAVALAENEQLKKKGGGDK